MQLIAQPPMPTASPSINPFLPILTTLRAKPVDASHAAPPSTAASAASAAATSSPATVVEPEPTLGAKLLAGVGSKQNQYLANQQMLGLITAALGQRLSQIGTQAWAMLRGTQPAGEA
jgi:hypothetical protein